MTLSRRQFLWTTAASSVCLPALLGAQAAPAVQRTTINGVPAAVAQVRATANRTAVDVTVVAVGSMAGLGRDAAALLEAQGLTSRVIDPRWVAPLPGGVVDLSRTSRLVAVIEDGIRAGGAAAHVRAELSDAGVHTPVLSFGVPATFLAHAKRAEVLAEIGLTAQDVARALVEALVGQDDDVSADTRQGSSDPTAATPER